LKPVRQNGEKGCFHCHSRKSKFRKLVATGKTDLLPNFISKRGNKFAAHLVLSAKKDKAEFEFLPR
jgi:DNA topoisomerase-like protein